MEEMTLLGTFRAELMVGTAWKEVVTDAGKSHMTYWLHLQNGRREVLAVHANQVPELLTVVGQALSCIREAAPAFTLRPEPRDAASSRKQS